MSELPCCFSEADATLTEPPPDSISAAVAKILAEARSLSPDDKTALALGLIEREPSDLDGANDALTAAILNDTTEHEISMRVCDGAVGGFTVLADTVDRYTRAINEAKCALAGRFSASEVTLLISTQRSVRFSLAFDPAMVLLDVLGCDEIEDAEELAPDWAALCKKLDSLTAIERYALIDTIECMMRNLHVYSITGGWAALAKEFDLELAE